jgi:hypothetical protein
MEMNRRQRKELFSLLKKFASHELDSLLEKVSIILLPQVNPDVPK